MRMSIQESRPARIAIGIATAVLSLSLTMFTLDAQAESTTDETAPAVSAEVNSDSEIAPCSFFETVVNTYDALRTYYTGYKFNPDYRTISYKTDFYEVSPTYLYSKGYNVWSLNTPSGTYLGNVADYMDHYQANYKVY